MKLLVYDKNEYWPIFYILIELGKKNKCQKISSGGAMQGFTSIGYINFETVELTKYMYNKLKEPTPQQLQKLIKHIFKTDKLDISGIIND